MEICDRRNLGYALGRHPDGYRLPARTHQGSGLLRRSGAGAGWRDLDRHADLRFHERLGQPDADQLERNADVERILGRRAQELREHWPRRPLRLRVHGR